MNDRSAKPRDDDRHPVIRIENLSVAFNVHGTSLSAIEDVSFDVCRSETVAVVGESGSGKSVTAQAILRILPKSASITSGSILFQEDENTDSVDITTLDADGTDMRAIRGGQISMIFQEPMVALSPLHTIGDQVSEALFLHSDSNRAEGVEKTEYMLDLVGFKNPKRALDTYPFELSGGLRQRAMIAMALICNPTLLIADEPTTALDVTIQAQILKLIRDLQGELNTAVLIITHDLGVVANVADRVVVMYHGSVLERGNARDIFENPGHAYTRALHRAVPHFDMKPGERLQPIRDVGHDPAGIIGQREAWPAEASKAPHLSVKKLVRSFSLRNSGWFGNTHSEIRAVDNVSFDIMPGECFGLVGESGCGKTTLAKILMRAIKPDSGDVHYNDRGISRDILAMEEDKLKKFRTKMQFIFQDPFSSLNPRMTVLDILREPLFIHDIGDDESRVNRAKDLMKLVGLDPRFLNRYPHSFSGGQRQRVGIARALALDPDFLICDEPVSALDVSVQAQILNLLLDLKQELGLTYLFISHNLAVVDYIADRIAVMCRGRIVEIAPREVLFADPVHPYTLSLLEAVPFPDLDRQLDFDHLSLNSASDPTLWPAPFTIGESDNTALVAITEQHAVRRSA